MKKGGITPPTSENQFGGRSGGIVAAARLADFRKKRAVKSIESPENAEIKKRKNNRNSSHDDPDSPRGPHRLHRVRNKSDQRESGSGYETAQRPRKLHDERLGRKENALIPGPELVFPVVDDIGEHDGQDSERKSDAEVDNSADQINRHQPGKRLLRQHSEQQKRKPRNRKESGSGKNRLPPDPGGEKRIPEQSAQLCDPRRRQIGGDLLFHPDHVLEIINCKSVRKLERNVEKQREDQHHDHLIIPNENPDHLLRGCVFPLCALNRDILLYKADRDKGTEQENSGDRQREPRKSRRLLVAAEPFHQFKSERTDHKPGDAREDPGNHRNRIALLLVTGQRRNHRPVRDIHDRVCQSPEKIGDRDVGELLIPGEPRIEEQKRQHDRIQNRPEQNPWPESPPPTPRIVDDQPHDRIVDRVEQPCREEKIPHENRTDFADVRQVKSEKCCDNRIYEILSKGADAV